MAAGEYDFTLEQGATFSKVLTWKDENGDPINLTGYTARMQLRRYPGDSELVAELTTENGGIALGGAAGTITLTIAATETEEIDTAEGKYDLELISGATVTRLLQGAWTLSKEVTVPTT